MGSSWDWRTSLDVAVVGRRLAGRGRAGKLVGPLKVAGDEQDVEVRRPEVVGKAEEGLDLGDVALVQDVADSGRSDAGVDGGGVGLDVSLLELAAEPGR